MMKHLNKNMRLASLVSGAALVLMTMAAAFSYGFVNSKLIDLTSEMVTLKNIQTNGTLFRLGIVGWIIIIIADLAVTWGFYVFFRDKNLKLSKLAALMRFIYTLILSMAVARIVWVNSIILSDKAIYGRGIEQVANDVMKNLNLFEEIWSVGLIIFGVHLFIIGVIAYKSNEIPLIIWVSLMVGGIGYIIVHGVGSFLPEAHAAKAVFENLLSLPMILGEIGLAVWLIIKGGK